MPINFLNSISNPTCEPSLRKLKSAQQDAAMQKRFEREGQYNAYLVKIYLTLERSLASQNYLELAGWRGQRSRGLWGQLLLQRSPAQLHLDAAWLWGERTVEHLHEAPRGLKALPT